MTTIQNPPTSAGNIPKPAQIHAPVESIDQFQALLQGMRAGLSNQNPVLSSNQKNSVNTRGDLIKDTAERLHKAEIALSELSWEIHKAAQPLGQAMPLSSQLPAQITQLKFATTAYFTNLMRAESGFGSLSEEIQALTKKRS